MAEVIHGPLMKNIVPNKTLGHLLYSALKSRSNIADVCFVEWQTGEDIKSSRLLEESLSLYQCLKQMNVDRSSVVAVITQNTWKTLLPILAGTYACIPVHLINAEFSVVELRHIISQSRPSAVFCFSAQLPAVLTLKKEFGCMKHVILIDEPQVTQSKQISEDGVLLLNDLLKSCGDLSNLRPEDADMDDLVFLLNSSGTTGMPKCVMMSHTNSRFIINNWQDEKVLRSTSDDTCVMFLPYYHLYGLYLQLISIYAGAKSIILNKFHGSSFIAIVKKYNPRILFMVPPLVMYFAKHEDCDEDLFRDRLIICGGSPLRTEIVEMMQKRYGVVIRQLYGLSEAGLVSMNFKDEVNPKGIGHIMPGTELKIVDHKTKKMLPAHEVGELCIRGGNVMKGYLNNEPSTKEVIDCEGFLHTGDLGYYDEDDNVFIVDRLKDVIKFKAHQVSPSQIEAILLKHPDVKDAAVTSVPDEYAGELPFGLIVKQQDAIVSEVDIMKHVKEHMSYCNQLHGGVKFVDSIPKSNTGKILRYKLKTLM